MAAMSSAVTIRRSETLARYCSRISSKDTPTWSARAWITLSMRGPFTMPGRIALARTPSGPISVARLLARPITPHFDAA